jgi:muramidase (phage lysozyme)
MTFKFNIQALVLKVVAIMVVTLSLGALATNINAIDNSVSGGTISKGGVFTPEVRAFLDSIAKNEAEGDILAPSSYNSGNYSKDDFDANSSTNLYPALKSNGVAPRGQTNPFGNSAFNIGRYQYFTAQYSKGDVESANKGLKLAGIDFTIVDFKPTSQDHYPLGKYSMRADLLKRPIKNLATLLSYGDTYLDEAIGISSGEWTSLPYVPGYEHADTNQIKSSLSEFKAYYKSRVAVYKSQGANSNYTPQAIINTPTVVAPKNEVIKETVSTPVSDTTEPVKTSKKKTYTKSKWCANASKVNTSTNSRFARCAVKTAN